MKIVVRVGLGIVHICPAIKQKGVLSILPKIQFSFSFSFSFYVIFYLVSGLTEIRSISLEMLPVTLFYREQVPWAT